MSSKLTKKKKRFIRDNHEKLSIAQLSKETKVPGKQIKKYLEEDLKRVSKRKNSQKPITNTDLENEKLRSFKDLGNFIKENRAVFAILAILCALVYANSLGGDFVSDDMRAYVDNTTVHSLEASLKTRNFNIILYSIFYTLFGLNEVPLHMFSVSLHILATMLGFVFISMIFDKRIGIIAALLFAVHPINSEAVNWISGRKYLMIASTIYFTTILYLIYKNSSNKKYLYWAVGFFTTVLLATTYSWLIVTPALIVIVDQAFVEKKINVKSALKTWPLFLTVGGFTAFFVARKFTQRVQNLQTEFNFDYQTTAPIYMRIPYTIYNTIKLYIFPKDLTLYHEGDVLSNGEFAFVVIVAIAFIALTIYLWKRNKLISGIFLFILVALAPTFSPTQVAWLVAERYMYTATIAFCALVAIALIGLEKKTKINNLTVILLVGLLIAYSTRTIIRNSDWSTRRTLWESTQRVSPNSARVYNNLGDVYGKAEEYQKAILMFETAIQVDPTYAEAMHNLGNTYARMGDFETAKEKFRVAYETKPSQYQSIHMLGVIELEEGNLDQAQSLFEEVLSIAPGYTPSQEGLRLTLEAKQNQ